MSEIPEDVRRMAQWISDKGSVEGLSVRGIAAAAILAERERCACICDVAEKYIIGPARDRETAFAVGEALATAIRTPPTGEET